MEEKWFAKLKRQAGEKWDGVKTWCRIHQGEIIVFGPMIAGGLIEIIKIGTRKHTVSEEKALKDRYIYDRSGGHYYELRRKPKNSEWIEIEERRNQGQNLGVILRDMRLLK